MLKEGAMGYFTVQDIALGHIKVEQYCPNCEVCIANYIDLVGHVFILLVLRGTLKKYHLLR